MMKFFWDHIDRLNLREGTKYRLCILAVGLCLAAAGALVWCVVSRWCLNTVVWLIVFAGYPFLAGLFWVPLYSGRHDFHNGAFKK